MPDRETTPDPMDKAYAQAEAVLSDDAARAARRAQVLAAVARETAAADAVTPPLTRPRAWRRGGWLVAASVAGLSVLVGAQVYQLTSIKHEPTPVTRTVPAAAPPDATGATTPPEEMREQAPKSAAPTIAAAAPIPGRERRVEPSSEISPAASLAPPPPPAAPAAAPPPAAPHQAAKPSETLSAPAVARRAERADDLAVTPQRRGAARASSGDAKVSATSPSPAADQGTQEVVVTARKRRAALTESEEARPSATVQAARLRKAAAAGRIGEMKELLADGAPVDARDKDGETALMKAVQANHPTAAAVLRRHGADLDLENRAGDTARDMAQELGDAELDQALGLGP